MSRFLGVLVLLFAVTSGAEAQLASTNHVFAQIADGRFADGTSYRTHFVVSNVDSTPSSACTIRLIGLSADRLSPSTFTLLNGSTVRVSTAGVQSFASGYATLVCSLPVKALAVYRYLSSTGVTLGVATVFPSPPTTYAYYVPTGGDRLAVAIANDTDNDQEYELVAKDAGGAVVASGRLSLTSHSNKAAFMDELMSLPIGYNGGYYINAAGGSTLTGAAFNTIGLAFAGNLFSTLPAFATVP